VWTSALSLGSGPELADTPSLHLPSSFPRDGEPPPKLSSAPVFMTIGAEGETSARGPAAWSQCPPRQSPGAIHPCRLSGLIGCPLSKGRCKGLSQNRAMAERCTDRKVDFQSNK
jgi:hypothetical protein